MRLIDADKLMEQVKVIHRGVDTSEINLDYDTGFHSATSQIQGLIETMPTVYDTDKVIRQLENMERYLDSKVDAERHKYGFTNDYRLLEGKRRGLFLAIEIVKGGE